LWHREKYRPEEVEIAYMHSLRKLDNGDKNSLPLTSSKGGETREEAPPNFPEGEGKESN
jgi:hypothetical protein